MLNGHTPSGPVERTVTTNGFGEPWDAFKPVFRGIDLTKPDPRIHAPDLSIASLTPNEDKVAFMDVNILDSTGALPYRGDVLVKGERIVSVGKKLGEEDKKGARVVDGQGRTLMSGLTDAHTHFTWTNSPSLDGLADMPVEEHTLFSARSASTFLNCGYTSCLGAASAKARLDLVIRDAINAGDIPGPRSLASAQEMAPKIGALIPGITRFVESPEEVKEVIEKLDEGIDQIKLSMSGEEITEHLRAEDTTIPDEIVAAAVEAAHSKGMRVCGHARGDKSILQCLQYGVDIIYHASFISDETMDALEAQKDRVFVAPALNWLVATLHDAAAFGYPTSKAESVGYARELEIASAGLKEMHRRGIRVLPGGDYGFAWTPHGTYRDLSLFVKHLNMSPMEAILSATKLGGEIMLHPDELGQIKEGFYADLLLVHGNPLEDISLLDGGKGLDMVMIVS
ncbi:hypothetical protein M231_05716 [Tremella mesenterica]|uniref:Amidohydrolase-related domain-containing protein n=1 Tax=Tremella mesenterica TaxID=5217 RepID=A0A4Q1BHD6_TREME|nr:hypothetical protein M231_05716 [Tremella mesenterica]